MLVYQKLTERIIGAALAIHKNLGPGLLESAYEECLAYELRERGMPIDRHQAVPVVYEKVRLDCGYRIDILVEKSVIVELKSVDVLLPVHAAQILTYMKFARKSIGLLINFNVKLLKDGLKRFVM